MPNILYTKEIKKYNSATGIDNQTLALNINTTYIYKQNITLSPLLGFKAVSYSDEDIVYKKKRRDIEIKSGIGVTYMFGKGWVMQGSFNHIEQVSNLEPNEYRKTTFGIKMMRQF